MPRKTGADVLIILGHFQKCLTAITMMNDSNFPQWISVMNELDYMSKKRHQNQLMPLSLVISILK
jgi:hypothetical protein